MNQDPQFREILYEDEYGYVTVGQMQFFLNRPNGEALFSKGHKTFKKYVVKCRIHNYLHDLMEEEEQEGVDPTILMFWDEKEGRVNYLIKDDEMLDFLEEIKKYAWKND